jgi:hypothetical protein
VVEDYTLECINVSEVRIITQSTSKRKIFKNNWHLHSEEWDMIGNCKSLLEWKLLFWNIDEKKNNRK